MGRRAPLARAELLLGQDEHGTWLFTPPGALTRRPGARFRHRRGSVICVPRGRWWIATSYDATTPGRIAVYVDVATPAAWSQEPGGLRVVHAVDLDLDVVQPLGGQPFVDDEAEFAQRSVRLGYPPEVAAARTAAAEVPAGETAASAPFDGPAARRWLSHGRLRHAGCGPGRTGATAVAPSTTPARACRCRIIAIPSTRPGSPGVAPSRAGTVPRA